MFSDLFEGPAWERLSAAMDEHGEPACAQSDPEQWFPEKGESVKHVKAICRRCPIKTECLEYALDTNQIYGIWGGLSYKERLRLRRL